MNKMNYYRGEPFPSLTADEAWLKDDLDPVQIQAGEAAFEANDLSEVVSGIGKRLAPWPRSLVVGSEFYGFVDALIQSHSKRRRNQGLLALEKHRVFDVIRPEIAFVLAIKCVRANDPRCLEVIVRLMSTVHHLRIKLARINEEGGDTLGHLAARCDHVKILQSLWRVDPDGIRFASSYVSDTIAHTACRFVSIKCIEFLEKTCPVLFTCSNQNAVTPLDILAPHVPHPERLKLGSLASSYSTHAER